MIKIKSQHYTKYVNKNYFAKFHFKNGINHLVLDQYAK